MTPSAGWPACFMSPSRSAGCGGTECANRYGRKVDRQKNCCYWSVLELGIEVVWEGQLETGESNPSYITCPLCWQSLRSSRDTFSEDGSPGDTDVQRMNSSKPGPEETNARVMFSLPVFLRLTHVSEGMKTTVPA